MKRSRAGLLLALLPFGVAVALAWYFRFWILNAIAQATTWVSLALGVETVPDADVDEDDDTENPGAVVPPEPEDAADLQATIAEQLGDTYEAYLPAIAAAAINQEPDLDAINATQFAYVIAADLQRESIVGAALKPAGASGTGDPGIRWKSSKPAWLAQFPQCDTGLTKLDSHGNTLYQVTAPAAFGATTPGWGYGLMQLDFESYYSSTAFQQNWSDPVWNINEGARHMSSDIDFLHSVAAGIAAYNHGRAGVRRNLAQGVDVDTNTTPGPRALNGPGKGDYSKDVLQIANGWGASLS